MAKALSPEKRVVIGIGAVLSLAVALVLASTIPVVEVLGDKVRLPIFHGGSTWVNLSIFGLMGLFALAYLVSSREDLYRWDAGFRWVAAPLWLVNTVLGLIAAIRTWDLSGSKQGTFSVVSADPRLVVQFQLTILLLVLVIVDKVFESRKTKAFFDLAFVAAAGVMMSNILTTPTTGSSVHPDNPVLNSAWDIKLPFFGIVGALFLMSCLLAWLVRDRIVRRD